MIDEPSGKTKILSTAAWGDLRPRERDERAILGQFFTSTGTARFMVDLFEERDSSECRLLDPGAGIGSLSDAFLEKWVTARFGFERVSLDAFEIDDSLCSALERTLSKYSVRPDCSIRVRNTDFVDAASDWLSGSLFAQSLPKYTHAILNPPYKKIRSDSRYRIALRRAGIETVNLYTAFVALALALLDAHGQLVAIIPRSFCNGPYYRPFRSFILERSSLRRMHLFQSRSRVFREDEVLQENLIILLERDGLQGPVTISTSTDDSFSDLTIYTYPFDQIVLPGDPESFIHVPASPIYNVIETSPAIKYSLADLGVSVSTGPVVDFRAKKHLRDNPGNDTAPLLYPSHFTDNGVSWPIGKRKRPNAIEINDETRKWLYPNGYYCVVRRFSSKEEKRRLVASVTEPQSFPYALHLGFENHLNVLHKGRSGLPVALAYGLASYLNTTAVDEYFRRFNGHTQVNATDLRLMRYPSLALLTKFGEWAMQHKVTSQSTIDAKFDVLIL